MSCECLVIIHKNGVCVACMNSRPIFADSYVNDGSPALTIAHAQYYHDVIPHEDAIIRLKAIEGPALHYRANKLFDAPCQITRQVVGHVVLVLVEL